MDMKTLKEFMNSSNSIYLILPPVALWAVTPFFETGAMFAVCLGIAAIAFALLAVKDYYDERHTNPWLKTKPEADRPLAPYEAGMVAKQGTMQKYKAASLGLLLAEIAAGFLSLTLGGITGRVSSLLCCILPMLTLALYLTSGTRAAIIEPENSFTNCGFGRIFGREKVCLIFHFAFAVGVWIQWLIVYDYQRGVTLLNRTKWLMLSIGIAAVLSAVFLVLSKEYRSHKILAALAMMMALANGFAFVWVVNVECDTAPAEKYDVTVTNNHLEKRLKSIGAHYENYLTVRYADGSILDLYEPYDFDFYEEGDRLTVIHHRGVLGIKWAELTQK